MPGCTSLSYEEPDTPPQPPRVETIVSSADDTAAATWSDSATAARDALRVGDLEAAEQSYMASLAATADLPERDVRRQTALANPARLVEAYQRAGRVDDAGRVTDAVLAEAQGARAFPLDAWTPALETWLDEAREAGGAELETEHARRIAEIHLGPLQGATPGEVELRARVGRLLAEAGDLESARNQLVWAARASRPMLRIPLEARLDLHYEAADVATEAGDAPAAELVLRAALELARGGGTEGPQLVGALNQLGWFLTEQGHHEEALALLEEARRRLDAETTPPALRAATLDSLAVAQHRSGQLEAADETFALAVAAREATSPEVQAALVSIDLHWDALRADLEASADEAVAKPAEAAPEPQPAAEPEPEPEPDITQF